MTINAGRTMEDFEAELAAAHMRGQWQYDRLLEQLVDGPRPAGIPFLWRWEEVYAKLQTACEVMPESFTARRNVTFLNPAGDRGTTHTLAMGMQMLKAGEVAWAHRHTPAAIRLSIMGGRNMVTVVDGEPCPMEDYDLVLTPRWTWHDHHNGTDEPAVWLDALDLGIVLGMNATFYEELGAERQPLRAHPGEYLQNRAGPMRPVWERRKPANFPYRYAWTDVDRMLANLAVTTDGSPHDAVALEYVNPMTGGPTTQTLGCWVQWLKPGQETVPHRHTSSGCFFVIRGEGTTVVDGVELDWSRHDTFCVPNWTRHHFVNRSATEEAVLFSVNDVPALTALGLYYEEPEHSIGSARWPPVPAKPCVEVLSTDQ